jgi:hypothetical protein
MAPFDPAVFDFVQLSDFRMGGVVRAYEYRNHHTVDGDENFLRLNVYLSKDGEFVTIWYGLLEPLFTEAELKEGSLTFAEKPDDLDVFLSSYNDDLFKGYIDSNETAERIFKALGLDTPRHALPSELRAGADNKLCCDPLRPDR